MIRSGYAIWLLAVCACGGYQPPNPSPGDIDACAAKCARLAELGCETAGPTPEGATCEDRCETAERSGYTTTHPACVAEATSCEDAEERSKRGCE